MAYAHRKMMHAPDMWRQYRSAQSDADLLGLMLATTPRWRLVRRAELRDRLAVARAVASVWGRAVGVGAWRTVAAAKETP
jgi:hypothetical protein